MSYQEFANYQLFSVYTNHESCMYSPLCTFCGKQVYPSESADKDHPGGYLAIYQGREVVMHGSCG